MTPYGSGFVVSQPPQLLNRLTRCDWVYADRNDGGCVRQCSSGEDTVFGTPRIKEASSLTEEGGVAPVPQLL